MGDSIETIRRRAAEGFALTPQERVLLAALDERDARLAAAERERAAADALADVAEHAHQAWAHGTVDWSHVVAALAAYRSVRGER